MPNKKSGFTLMEVLIGVLIVGMLTTTIGVRSYRKSLMQARDSARKQNLQKIARALEEYYLDNNIYPQSVNGRINNISWGGSFAPYLNPLPKDPDSPNKDFYYLRHDLIAGSPNAYSLYAYLEDKSDPDRKKLGCDQGLCTWSGSSYSFDYMIKFNR